MIKFNEFERLLEARGDNWNRLYGRRRDSRKEAPVRGGWVQKQMADRMRRDLDVARRSRSGSEGRNLPESVDLDDWKDRRDALLLELKGKFPGEFIKTSEEFSPTRVGGLWITGKKMADYYGKDNTGFDYWVNPKLQRVLARHKFMLEPYDVETWLAWPI